MGKSIFEKLFSDKMINDTNKYQKIYGFDDSGKNSTHNNEADAFKHAYMQAQLTVLGGKQLAEYFGNKHENEGNARNQPAEEENMDLWNNQQGREIGVELIREFGSIGNIPLTKETCDKIAEKVMQRMKSGLLITNPYKDERKFIKQKTKYQTDYSQNTNNLERIFTAEEIGDMSSEEYSLFEKYIDNQLKTFGIPRKSQADEEVKSGNLIWVNSYKRTDGTEVSGYYRKR